MEDLNDDVSFSSKISTIYVSDATANLYLTRIELNKLEYDSFGEEYERSGFSENTGGFWVTHINHDFDGIRGDYERNVARILYQKGYKVILDNENRGWGVKSPDGKLNDRLFDICSIEGTGENNIKSQLVKCNKKKVEVAVLYFPLPELFSLEKLLDGYYKYSGIKGMKSLDISYIVNGKIRWLKQKETR
jgi:hypothetical protein